MARTCTLHRRTLLAAAVLVAAAPVGVARVSAQEVVALVDGVPITSYDVQQRTKLLQLSAPKPVSRRQVIDKLIDEILELREAKNFGIIVPDSNVENSYATVAQHLGVSTAKLTQILKAGGASEATLKQKLRAQTAWNALVRGRYKASLVVPDSLVDAQMNLQKGTGGGSIGYEYIMRPIIFIVPPGSPDAAYAARMREADALRTRFVGCAEGIPFARALNAVAVREQVIRFSANLPKASRQILSTTPIGQLTPPERMADGVETFAVCGKRQTKSESPEKVKIHNELFQQKFKAQAARYLARLRRKALIQYFGK
jgi:peptidyl-prolyl cis-trans isomerase SurA